MLNLQKLQAVNGLQGQIQVPGDKSITHRALMIGAVAQGTTILRNFATGEDCQTTSKALKDLGVHMEQNQQALIIHGQGFAGLRQPFHTLQMNNSGTTTRLLLGLLAGSNFKARLNGDDSLKRRPMARVSQPLAQLGADITTNQGYLPLVIEGQSLKSTTIQLKVASAQVKSAIILAALQAQGTTKIQELLPTRNHTELMLQQFGANLVTDATNQTITVDSTGTLVGQPINVPGDISSAAFFLVAAAITPHSKITIKNVGLNPTRTKILTVLKQMGARIAITPHTAPGEPRGDVSIQTSHLQPIQLTESDIPALIDELPLLALLAAHADGVSQINGAQELRFKESDRLKTVAQELQKLGVVIQELPDGWIIDGTKKKHIQDVHLDSHGDHRIGMMLIIAALNSDAPLTLNNEAAIAISYPRFLTTLKKLLGARL
ncbi:3-phosphoshikimate 1-carboxyvinyltransferase [Bombilactobacillus thymidiniphilus]|uniref:3-phosphoshikimate 1-carboxyvinyltransferase n=1 Tax=Bombilactobacillus thymidiniphilus TaxID=2923363 RepID=A0ABY4PEG8_9LACO|nr:3-phosphoshikimate 1-carboxyvinyltransferase [Bombilactobacillus thymidiniphilus]UQS83955.1 3-phosphoshikimate 1-carboxyvinyltransferase [Bombilactobacillus thymidiniphilus]